jgi:hypothetical protein
MTIVHKSTLLSAVLNSFVLDYVARTSVGGANLNFFLLKQLPVPPPDTFEQRCAWSTDITLAEWIFPRVLELTYTAVDMEPFARDLGYQGPPFVWDDERRFWIRAELDAGFFHVYGVERLDAEFIMDTFHVVRDRDIREHGFFRTKEAILDLFDQLASGTPFRSNLAPPPASGWRPRE